MAPIIVESKLNSLMRVKFRLLTSPRRQAQGDGRARVACDVEATEKFTFFLSYA